MKLIWVFCFYVAFSAEVRVKASVSHNVATKTSKTLSCEDSWIENNKLIAGCHWITKAENATMETEYGTVSVRNGDYAIRKADGRIYVVNHLGDMRVELRDGRIVQVPPGFEFWFSEVDENKKNQIGLLRPVDMPEHIKFLGSVWQDDAKSFKDKIELYKTRWGNRTEMASKFYQGLALRKIASDKAAEEGIQKRKEAEARRREANRKMLFDRVFGR